VEQILGHLAEIDEIIVAHVQNFRLERLTPVDRNIMRLAVYELKHTDVPVPVVLDEAIEISKKYGTSESGGFVNGVLDRIAKSLPPSAIRNPQST
jgi:N utilization substance protein B